MTYSSEYRRILSRMGYYDYQSGLIYRHLGQDGGWDEHLQRCRSYILGAIGRFSPSKVTILGSGWLLDIPLAEMLGKTEIIELVDIVHPPEVIRQVSSLNNVKLIEADVSGGLIEKIWKSAGGRSYFNRLKSVSDIQVPEYEPATDQGMIISLNILTQLETLIINFLKSKTRANHAELQNLRTQIQQKHISFLKRHTSVLISDTEETFFDEEGGSGTVPTLLTPVEGDSHEEWTWGFDLKGSDFNTVRSSMKVIAVTYCS